jgi:hypothetical protein
MFFSLFSRRGEGDYQWANYQAISGIGKKILNMVSKVTSAKSYVFEKESFFQAWCILANLGTFFFQNQILTKIFRNH